MNLVGLCLREVKKKDVPASRITRGLIPVRCVLELEGPQCRHLKGYANQRSDPSRPKLQF